MLDNMIMVINDHQYIGVEFDSKEEAANVLHPSYWDSIPVGHKMSFNKDSIFTILIRLCENVMLIRRNGSRHFVQIKGRI